MTNRPHQLHLDGNAKKSATQPFQSTKSIAVMALAMGMVFAAGAAQAAVFQEGFESATPTQYTIGSPGAYGVIEEATLGVTPDRAKPHFIETIFAPAEPSNNAGGDLTKSFFSGWEGDEYFSLASSVSFGNGEFGNPNDLAQRSGKIDFATGLSDASTPGLRLTVALAANQGVMSTEYIRIYIGTGAGSDFPTLLAQTTVVSNNLVLNDTVLNATFQDFIFDLPTDITNLRIRIQAQSDGNTRMIGIDDVRISVIPEPSSIGLSALGGLLLCPRRSRR